MGGEAEEMTREEAVRFLVRHPEKFGHMVGLTLEE